MGVLVDPAAILQVAKAIQRQGFTPARAHGEAFDFSRMSNTTTIGILMEEEKTRLSRWEEERRRMIGSLTFNGDRWVLSVYGHDIYLLADQLARKLEEELRITFHVIIGGTDHRWEYLPSDDRFN